MAARLTATFSSEYTVRRIREKDISQVYHLYIGNRRFYRQEGGVRPYLRDLTDVITNAGTNPENSCFVGFFDAQDHLTAILDLTIHYPSEGCVFIGWFMVEAQKQRRGIGSQIIADVRASLSAQGFHHLAVGIRQDSTDASSFWKSQGFSPEKKETPADPALQDAKVLLLGREI